MHPWWVLCVSLSDALWCFLNLKNSWQVIDIGTTNMYCMCKSKMDPFDQNYIIECIKQKHRNI